MGHRQPSSSCPPTLSKDLQAITHGIWRARRLEQRIPLAGRTNRCVDCSWLPARQVAVTPPPARLDSGLLMGSSWAPQRAKATVLFPKTAQAAAPHPIPMPPIPGLPGPDTQPAAAVRTQGSPLFQRRADGTPDPARLQVRRVRHRGGWVLTSPFFRLMQPSCLLTLSTQAQHLVKCPPNYLCAGPSRHPLCCARFFS